jgi:hypothetical protein
LLAAGLGGLAAIALFLSLLAGQAEAATNHVYDSAFEMPTLGKSGTAAAAAGRMAIDEETGYVYVMKNNSGGGGFQGDIEKVDPEGNPSIFPGAPGPNETQTVNFSGFLTGNLFTLTCPNGETTDEIEWNSSNQITPASIQAGLEAKCGAGNFTVTNSSINANVLFKGAYASTNVPQMTCTTTAGSGTCQVTNEVNGAPETNVLNTPCENSCLQIAVDNSGGPNQGVIYLSTTGASTNLTTGGIFIYLPSGEFVGRMDRRSGATTRSCGVAVDDNGDLIVSHGEGVNFSYIDKLDMPNWGSSPTFEPPILGTIKSDSANICRTEVDDESGQVYTSQSTSSFGAGAIRAFDTDDFEIGPTVAATSRPFISGSWNDLELSGDNIFVIKESGGEIRKYDKENGSLIEILPAGAPFSRANGIARNDATGTLYASDAVEQLAVTTDVHVYKPVVVPDSLTGDFTPVTAASGVLDGEVDPAGAGEIEDCQFEVAGAAKFSVNEFAEATVIPCEPGAPLNSAEEVTANVGGLTLEETQHFRVRTNNANGQSNGTVHTFIPHAVIDIKTQPATNVAPRSATLHGTFIGDGDDTEYAFEYGNLGAGVYTKTSAVETVQSPAGLTEVSIPIEELELETTYHFRATATNSTGTSKGFDFSFTTPPAVDGLQTTAATDIGQDGIKLTGQFNGDGSDHHYYFEYGLTDEYGMVSEEAPGSDAGSPVGVTQVSSVIDDYEGYKTYHYRIVAENGFGVSYGQDETFETPAAPLPDVQGTSATNITPTSATLSAEVNPNRWPTTYLFEWGPTASYGTATEFGDVLEALNNEPLPVSVDATGLTPGILYHYRVVAVNLTGVVEGPDQTFITPDVPSVEGSSATAVGQTTAQLNALVSPKGSFTNVRFEYGSTAAYGASTGPVGIGSSLLAQPTSAAVGGLVPDRTYHFRVVATNGIGTTFGPDQVLTTAAAPTPAPSRDCQNLARRAKKNSDEAKRLRRQASRSSNSRQSRRLRRRAAQSAKKARQLSSQAKACRRNGGSA